MTVPKNTYTAEDMAEAFQAGLDLGRRISRDDRGFAESFLQRQLAAREHQFTEDEVRQALDGEAPVVGIDPDAIAAARSISRLLEGVGR